MSTAPSLGVRRFKALLEHLLGRLRVKLGPIWTLLKWISSPIFLAGMMLYMIVSFISILLIPIFRLRFLDKVGEKTVFRITNLVSVTLVGWFIYQNINPGLLNSSILDLVLAYLVVVALVGIIVMSQVVIFLVVGRFWEKIQHYPSFQFILILLFALLVIGALSSNEVRDCEVVWTRRGAVCE